MDSDVSPAVVRLNIGGTKFCTTSDTLRRREPNSMLAAMLNDGHTVSQDSEKGYVFIDRDGKHFRHILNWLRDGVISTLSDIEYSELKREAEYYQLFGLIDRITAAEDKRKENGLVHLNIGGEKFCTTIDTLSRRVPDSMLAAMFSGRHSLSQDSEGYVFVDRDGKHFRHILNWMRDGVVPTLNDLEYFELIGEAEYYQLLGLIDEIDAAVSKRKENEDLETELTRKEIIKCIQSKRVRFRGLRLSGLDLSKLDLSYADFSYACLKNVSFSMANLVGARFRDVDAEASIFDNADLSGCDFRRANLCGASLAGANLQRANFLVILQVLMLLMSTLKELIHLIPI